MDDRQPVHQPADVLARDLVAQDDVGLAVAVEVADALHLPVRVGNRRQERRRRDREPVHQPPDVLTVGLVAPDDIGLSVPSKSPAARNSFTRTV